MMQHPHVTDRITETASQTMTYGGGATAVTAWGLSLGDIAAIVGAFVAILGFAVQMWATRRRDLRELEQQRREKELHESIMRNYEDGAE